MLLTETWLRPVGDEAKIADLAPPGYSVLSFPRSAGGPAQKAGASLRDSLKPHVATASSFLVQHLCFETAQLTNIQQATNQLILYLPPSTQQKEQIL